MIWDCLGNNNNNFHPKDKPVSFLTSDCVCAKKVECGILGVFLIAYILNASHLRLIQENIQISLRKDAKNNF